MKYIRLSRCRLLCVRLEYILSFSIMLMLLISFNKRFDYVTSFHTSAFAGKLMGATKSNNHSNSYKAINASSTPDIRRKNITPEANEKDRFDTYIVRNENICSGVNDLAIVLVHTAIGNFERRQQIRNTWGNISLFEKYKMRVVFLLGKPDKKQHQTAINLESKQHNDIVQGLFLDTYHNLTYKAILGLRWVMENCKQARFVLKVDDDVVVNTPRVLKILATKYAHVNRTIFCSEIRLKGKHRIHRDGKWKVEKTQFPNMTHWLVKHCPGRFIVYTGDIIEELLVAVDKTPFLWLDDVYVTGFLAAKVGNIKHLNDKDVTKQVKWLENAKLARLVDEWNRFAHS